MHEETAPENEFIPEKPIYPELTSMDTITQDHYNCAKKALLHFHWSRSYLFCDAELEFLIRDTINVAWENRAKMRRKSSVSSWIYGVGKRKTWDRIRERTRFDSIKEAKDLTEEFISPSTILEKVEDFVQQFVKTSSDAKVKNLLQRVNSENPKIAEMLLSHAKKKERRLDMAERKARHDSYMRKKEMRAEFKRFGSI